MYAFFLSYAAGEDKQAVHRFFRELSDDVRAQLGLAAGDPVGYLARAEQPVAGVAESRSAADDALETSACFVALYSERYGLSVECEREWAAFESRVAAFAEENPSATRPDDTIVPVIWTPPGPDPLPEPVTARQRRRFEYFPHYAEHGLRALMGNDAFRATYTMLRRDLAAQIVSMVRLRQPLPRPRAGDPATPSGIRVPQQRRQVRRFVRIVVAAGTADEMRQARRRLKYYGNQPTDWNPYYEEDRNQSLTQYAQEVAAERKFGNSVAPLNDLDREVSAARNEGHLVVLLSDVWLSNLNGRADVLVEFDNRDDAQAGVFVPIGVDDEDAAASRSALEDRAREMFPRYAGRIGGRKMFHVGLPRKPDFGQALSDFLEHGLFQLQAQPEPPPPDDGPFSPRSWYLGPDLGYA